MKVIDLLNKIANGEEIPEKIKYKNKTYEDEPSYLMYEVTGEATEEEFKSVLNDEVEIIEEDKEIKEIEIYSDEEDFDEKIHFKNIMRVSKNGEFEVTEEISVIVDKINELVKAVNEFKKGK